MDFASGLVVVIVMSVCAEPPEAAACTPKDLSPSTLVLSMGAKEGIVPVQTVSPAGMVIVLIPRRLAS